MVVLGVPLLKRKKGNNPKLATGQMMDLKFIKELI